MENYKPESREFVFETYKFDLVNLQAHFYYSLHDKIDENNILLFEEVIDFDDGHFDIRSDLNYDILDNLLFHLHIALGISYYKLYPTEKLIIKSGTLDIKSVNFWKKFYQNWLGEFLFTNEIKPQSLFQFEIQSYEEKQKIDYEVKNRALVAIWWGKDSIVSLEISRKLDIDFDTFVFWKLDQIKENTVKYTGQKNMLITRKLSENIFKLNETWKYFNGHVPITGIIAFVMQAAGYLYDYKYFVLSNEYSANFWNTLWEWVDINHQWSKSLEFELDFWEYIKNNISAHTSYFSLLRPLYEIKIAELFSELWGKYFESFSSCNNNFKIQNASQHKWLWCNTCPKCAFVYTMLHPFIEQDVLMNIFWEDLYNNLDLKELYEELMWISGIKPFECVGTNEEVIYAMYLSYQKYYWDNKKVSYILGIFKESILPNLTESKLEYLQKKLFGYHDMRNIPEVFKKFYWK